MTNPDSTEKQQDGLVSKREDQEEVNQDFRRKRILLRVMHIPVGVAFPQQPAGMADHHVQGSQPPQSVQEAQG
jgi:hypothetical protein